MRQFEQKCWKMWMPFTLNLSFLQKLLFLLFLSMFHPSLWCFVCLLSCEYVLSDFLSLHFIKSFIFVWLHTSLWWWVPFYLTFLIIFIHSSLVIFMKEAISSQSLGFRCPIFTRAWHRPAFHHLTPLSSPLPQLKPLPFCSLCNTECCSIWTTSSHSGSLRNYTNGVTYTSLFYS